MGYLKLKSIKKLFSSKNPEKKKKNIQNHTNPKHLNGSIHPS